MRPRLAQAPSSMSSLASLMPAMRKPHDRPSAFDFPQSRRIVWSLKSVPLKAVGERSMSYRAALVGGSRWLTVTAFAMAALTLSGESVQAQEAIVLATDGRSLANESFETRATNSELRARESSQILAWNEAAYELFRANPAFAGSIIRQARTLGLAYVSVHNSLNAIVPRYEPYLATPARRPNASPEAAIAGAAYGILIRVFPTATAVLNPVRDAALAKIPDGPAKTSGFELGEEVAAAVFQARANDNNYTYLGLTPRTFTFEPGTYHPIPENNFAQVGLNQQIHLATPIGIESLSQFMPGGPPALTSHAYTRDYNETKSLGAKVGSGRTQEQTDIGVFWYEGNTADSWSRIARTVMAQDHHNAWDEARTLSVFYMSLLDTTLAVFVVKWQYANWRPVSAIWAGDNDGNPNTVGDPSWTSNMPIPGPFPDYPSVHASTCEAAARALIRNLGNHHRFSQTSPSSVPAGQVREYRTLSQASEDCGLSRIYVGIHFRAAVRDGAWLGRNIARYIDRNLLKPIRHHGGHHGFDNHDDDDHDD